jgi:SAM-dependent methyltransferase
VPATRRLDVIEPATARWLISAEGLEAVASVTARLDAGDDPLTITQELRSGGIDPATSSAVLTAATARQRARRRWPDADRLLFTREALEQASDPEVSAWRARRLGGSGRRVLDLCAGAGGDTLALGALGTEVVAVDLDPARLILLEHNARVRGLEVRTQAGDALDVDVRGGWWIHADPGRRRGERRVRRLRDHLPPVAALVAHVASAPGTGVVLSPAVDLDDPDLPDGELEFVQLGPDLVEAVVWLGDARRDAALASCTLLPSGAHLTRVAPPARLPTGHVGAYLVQVEPAAIRARLHDHIGAGLDARRVARDRALLTTDVAPPTSPWFRVRRVEEVLPARAKVLRRWLRSAPQTPLEIAFHGIDGSVDRWWRELGRPPRGPDGRRLELVRTADGAIAVMTSPIDAQARDGGPPQGEPASG